MFRVKTRRVKRATSPLPVIPPSPLHHSPSGLVKSEPVDISGSIPPIADISGALMPAPAPTTLMGRLTNFFEAESHAASTTKPWLRLERGLRLQKLRTSQVCKVNKFNKQENSLQEF